MKYQFLPPRSNTARAVPAVSAWVSSVQWLLTGLHVFDVKSEVAAAVIMTVRFFSLATTWTASAIAVTGRSTTASTFSTSNQRRAMAEATSGLFWWSAETISIGLPFRVPPKSRTAISAAATEPLPPLSA
jgi:hypothetical protein